MKFIERVFLKAIVLPIILAFVLLPRSFFYLTRGNRVGCLCFICFVITTLFFLMCRIIIIKKYKNVRKLYVHVAVDTSLFVIGCFVSCCMQNRENFSWLALLLSICFTIPFFALNQITERRISNNDNTWL